MNRLLLTFLTVITIFLTPVAAFANISDLSPAVSDISKSFSEKFCNSIENDATPDKAGELASAQLSQGLLFSPVMNEIMSTPKKDLVKSISNNIFDICEDDLGESKEDLDNYLIQLANKIPTKSSNVFQLPPTRQKPYK